MAVSWESSSVVCPYYKDSDGHNLICCEGIIPGTKMKSFFYHRTEFRAHMTKYCCSAYWNCPVCAAIDNKYEEDEHETL